MLEQLQVSHGHRVLEIGTGTGYDAALLAVLAGPDGCIVSVEVYPELAEHAAMILTEVGAGRVQVVTGNGEDGYPPRSPYDRVIVTAGAREVSRAWSEQLREGGRLVVPIVDETGVGSITVFDKVNGELVRRQQTPCGFLPMRSDPNA
jgi:protein-L-isoaspartate(D-aspartate) O-methyltransferase